VAPNTGLNSAGNGEISLCSLVKVKAVLESFSEVKANLRSTDLFSCFMLLYSV